MKILFAEDDTNIAQIAKMVLEKIGGHDITVAVDGSQALDLALNNTYDLIILDGMMPHLSGTEVCKQYKSKVEGGAAPVIFLSAKSSPQDICEFLDLGVGYIQKPFNPQTLCQQIDTILKGAA